jgi:multiple sugar transport system permease protein
MNNWVRKYLRHFLMLTPFFIFFSIFLLYPIFKGFYISFFRWDAVHPAVFVGLDNYISVANSSYFGIAIFNLLKYVSITVPVGILLSFLVALLVDSFEGIPSGFFRSTYFVPTMIPLFLAASVWRWIYTPEIGIINIVLGWLHIPPVNWLTDPKVMILSLVIVDNWRSIGFNMVILLAGLKNIPGEYYDAAEVDGANKFQEVIYITIPQLRPVLFFTIAYGFISALQVFDAPWLMTASQYSTYGGHLKGLLFPVMDMMGRAFGNLQFGQASAYGFMLMLIILVVTGILFRVQRRLGGA